MITIQCTVSSNRSVLWRKERTVDNRSSQACARCRFLIAHGQGSTATLINPSLQATLWALVGMWISNGVALWRLDAAIAAAADSAEPELLPLLRMPGGTPRSLLVHSTLLDGSSGLSQAFLFAGSSSGEVAFCPIHSSGAGLSLGEACFQHLCPVQS